MVSCAASVLQVVAISSLDHTGLRRTQESATDGHRTRTGLSLVCILSASSWLSNLEKTPDNDWHCTLSREDHVCADTGHTKSKQPQVPARLYGSWIGNYEFWKPSWRTLLTFGQVCCCLDVRLLNGDQLCFCSRHFDVALMEMHRFKL